MKVFFDPNVSPPPCQNKREKQQSFLREWNLMKYIKRREHR